MFLIYYQSLLCYVLFYFNSLFSVKCFSVTVHVGYHQEREESGTYVPPNPPAELGGGHISFSVDPVSICLASYLHSIF